MNYVKTAVIVTLLSLGGACSKPEVTEENTKRSESNERREKVESQTTKRLLKKLRQGGQENSVQLVSQKEGLSGGPKFLIIKPDEWHLPHVGKTRNGDQYLLTEPFGTAEYVALYLWDEKGEFKSAIIKNLGKRGTYALKEKIGIINTILHGLGDSRAASIKIKPMMLQAFGEKIGFEYSEFEGEKNVSLMPGDYVAFTEPWMGSYDT